MFFIEEFGHSKRIEERIEEEKTNKTNRLIPRKEKVRALNLRKKVEKTNERLSDSKNIE